jgi:ABC-type multidrug transport system ATPase subunit
MSEPAAGAMSEAAAGADDAPVELRHVSKWYGDVVAVADVSFTVGPGITGLLGPNGAGCCR